MQTPFEKSNSQYCLLVNKPELYEAAKREHYQDVLLIQGLLHTHDILRIKEGWKAVHYVFYSEEGCTPSGIVHKQLMDNGIPVMGWTFPDDENLYSDPPISSLQDLINNFPEKNRVETRLLGRGLILDTDYTGRCGNCHAHIAESDKYCKYCGTKRGEGRFLPFENPMYCVYGPPIKKRYQCKSCGFKWVTAVMGGDQDSLYCPQCGEEQVSLLETKILDFEEYFDELNEK